MVDIIPKQVKETPYWQVILFYSLVFLLIILIVVYFILGYIQGNSKVYLEDLEKKLSEARSPQVASLEQEVFSEKTNIDNFSPFFKRHVLSSKFFEFIEARTHPKVYFYNLELNPKISQASLSGLTNSFLSLGQQVLILKKEPLVGNLELLDISFSEGGGIQFRLNILFSEKLFSY
jgi:hypothetical protein